MQRASRHDLVRALAPRYGHVSKSEKGQILDQVCEVTGYTRKYALTLLKYPPDEPAVKRTRRRSPSYGPTEVELLRLCWLVTDGDLLQTSVAVSAGTAGAVASASGVARVPSRGPDTCRRYERGDH